MPNDGIGLFKVYNFLRKAHVMGNRKRTLLLETERGVFEMKVFFCDSKSIQSVGRVLNLTNGKISFFGPPRGLISSSQIREAYRLDLDLERERINENRGQHGEKE